jgi:hypothetical protein
VGDGDLLLVNQVADPMVCAWTCFIVDWCSGCLATWIVDLLSTRSGEGREDVVAQFLKEVPHPHDLAANLRRGGVLGLSAGEETRAVGAGFPTE